MSSECPIDSMASRCKEVSTASGLDDLWPEYQAVLDEAESPSDNVDLLEAYCEAIARAELDEGYLSNKEIFIQSMADLASGSNVTHVRNIFDHVKQDVKSADMDDSDIHITDLLHTELEKVIKHENTDTDKDPTYSWVFDADAELVVTTGGEYKQEGAFVNRLEETLDRNIYPTGDDITWSEWIQNYRVSNQDIDRTTGPRTQAMDKLAAEIQSRPAYLNDLTAAVRQNVTFLEDEEAGIVQVPKDVVQRVASEHDVTMTAMHSEMSAKNKLAQNARTTHTSTGRQVRMWMVKRTWAEPDEVVDIEDEDPLGSDSV